MTAQIIGPVLNDGGTWIELASFQSSFTVYDADGSITETDSFDTAAPTLLGPGEVGYLLGEVFTDEHPRSAFNRVEFDGYFDEAREPEGGLVVENTRVRRGGFDGVEVTGEVRNDGPERVENATVVALFFADDDPIGHALGYIENIEPGGQRAFQIDSSFAEIRLSDIEETLFFADDLGF